MNDLSVTRDIEEFTNAFKGGMGAIISHGPSELLLTKEHLSGVDVVITLNAAILKVRSLALDIPVFTMQKDAGEGRSDISQYETKRTTCTCLKCDEGCTGKQRPVLPETLLIHKHESHLCYPDYSKRVEFDHTRFNIMWSYPSIISAIYIMSLFGVEKVNYLCFDGICGISHDDTEDGKTLHAVEMKEEDRRRKREYDTIKALISASKKYRDMDAEWIIPT